MTDHEALRELIHFKNKYWDGMPEECIDIAVRALSDVIKIKTVLDAPDDFAIMYIRRMFKDAN